MVPYRDDLDYLQDELLWIEARCTRIGTAKGIADLHEGDEQGFFAGRGLSPQELRSKHRKALAEEAPRRARVDACLATTRAEGRRLALDEVCERCGLDPFERTVLLLAAAPCISRRFDDLLGEAAGPDASGGLTVEAAFAFCELSFRERVERRSCFSPIGALIAGDLLSCAVHARSPGAGDLLHAGLEITRRTFAHLVGRDDLDDELRAFSSVEDPKATFEQVVLPAEDSRRIRAAVERHDELLRYRAEWGIDEVVRYGRGTMMLFFGSPGTGKTMTAHAVADFMGKRVFNVDIPAFLEHKQAERFLPGLFREARLQDAVLFFDECEVLFGSRHMGNLLMTSLLTELERFEGVAILATNLPHHLDEALTRRILVRVRFPEPDKKARAEIWRRHLPPSAPQAVDVDVDALAERYELSGGLIKNAVLGAVATAVHEAEEEPLIRHVHLERAAKDQLLRFDAKGEPVKVPEARLSDLILPSRTAESLEFLLGAVRSAHHVRDVWGVGGRGEGRRGVAALFHGPPGTGKTLCAEALAGELNRPLHTARASAMLSMYVGESERKLAEAFATARAEQAVLLVDEADGLLMDRAEGRPQRHELTLVNTLLELIEQQPGLVLLATNLPDKLDRALERRLMWRVDFQLPDRADRLRLWRRMLPEAAPLAEDVDFHRLAEPRLSGAQIRQAAVRAACIAAAADRNIRMADLVAASAERRGARRPCGFQRSA